MFETLSTETLQELHDASRTELDRRSAEHEAQEASVMADVEQAKDEFVASVSKLAQAMGYDLTEDQIVGGGMMVVGGMEVPLTFGGRG